MSAQIISARSIVDGRRGTAGRLGKGPIIGVAIVALLVAVLLGGHTLTQPRSASHNANVTELSVPGPSVSTAQYDDDLMTQQDDFLHTTLPSVTAPQSIGVTGCNDEMLCLSMYAPNPAATGGAAVSGCGDEMMCPWMYGQR